MLTVDYDVLGLQAGERLLDLGCGFGRHSYEAVRRGADVVACDLALGELGQVSSMFAAMAAEGQIAPGSVAAAVAGDATRLPFADASFDRLIASEVMEHVPDDEAALDELIRVLRPGGTLAITVPSYFPERICWAITDEYHAPKVPGGHVRIYREGELRRKMRAAGLVDGPSRLTHALHSPYWWLKCAVGTTNDDHPLVKAYHQILVWDIEKAPAATRLTERLLNPVLGKSLVVYATRPPEHAEPTSRPRNPDRARMTSDA